jgi:hypothetical protein
MTPIPHGKEPSMPILAHSSNHDHSEISNHPGLLTLLAYAHSHRHSSQWIGAILTIFERKGGCANA